MFDILKHQRGQSWQVIVVSNLLAISWRYIHLMRWCTLCTRPTRLGGLLQCQLTETTVRMQICRFTEEQYIDSELTIPLSLILRVQRTEKQQIPIYGLITQTITPPMCLTRQQISFKIDTGYIHYDLSVKLSLYIVQGRQFYSTLQLHHD